jgi:hypothetical protein
MSPLTPTLAFGAIVTAAALTASATPGVVDR